MHYIVLQHTARYIYVRVYIYIYIYVCYVSSRDVLGQLLYCTVLCILTILYDRNATN